MKNISIEPRLTMIFSTLNLIVADARGMANQSLLEFILRLNYSYSYEVSTAPSKWERNYSSSLEKLDSHPIIGANGINSGVEMRVHQKYLVENNPITIHSIDIGFRPNGNCYFWMICPPWKKNIINLVKVENQF